MYGMGEFSNLPVLVYGSTYLALSPVLHSLGLLILKSLNQSLKVGWEDAFSANFKHNVSRLSSKVSISRVSSACLASVRFSKDDGKCRLLDSLNLISIIGSESWVPYWHS